MPAAREVGEDALRGGPARLEPAEPARRVPSR